MSWIKDLAYGAMKCGQGDPTGEKYEQSKDANGCKEVGAPSGGNAGGGGMMIVEMVLGNPMDAPSSSLFSMQFEVKSISKPVSDISKAIDDGVFPVIKIDAMGTIMFLMLTSKRLMTNGNKGANLSFSAHTASTTFGVELEYGETGGGYDRDEPYEVCEFGAYA